MDQYLSNVARSTLIEAMIQRGLLEFLLKEALQEFGARVLTAASDEELKKMKSHFDGAVYFADKIRMLALEVANEQAKAPVSVQFDS